MSTDEQKRKVEEMLAEDRALRAAPLNLRVKLLSYNEATGSHASFCVGDYDLFVEFQYQPDCGYTLGQMVDITLSEQVHPLWRRSIRGYVVDGREQNAAGTVLLTITHEGHEHD